MSETTKNDIFEAGLALRRQVLGNEYIDRVFALKDEFSDDLQDYITTHAWGAVWARRGDDGELTLPKKTRSIMNLAMLAAINRPHELEIHIRGAINNGVTKKEMLEIFLHVATYAGAPALLDAVRIARKVWAEQEQTAIV
ncbi:MAG: carboxymuconolactone decarboxylase family protein [Betaproteobacteria bacterium]|jgi:4-carboxymuconolactone decarboxylase|nr:MAG: carboxymuconolactone decarboxylase family protein [Betaproteobacteria bacterium]